MTPLNETQLRAVRDAVRLVFDYGTKSTLRAQSNADYQGLVEKTSADLDFLTLVQSVCEGARLRIVERDRVGGLMLLVEEGSPFGREWRDIGARLVSDSGLKADQKLAVLCAVLIGVFATFYPSRSSLFSRDQERSIGVRDVIETLRVAATEAKARLGVDAQWPDEHPALAKVFLEMSEEKFGQDRSYGTYGSACRRILTYLDELSLVSKRQGADGADIYRARDRLRNYILFGSSLPVFEEVYRLLENDPAAVIDPES